MQKELFDNIVAALLPEMGDAGARKSLVEGALLGSPLLQKIQWDGAADTFTKRLVRQLDEFGQVAPGKPAIVALLEEAKGQVGTDRQAQIEILLAQLKTSPAKPSSRDKIQPPPPTFTEGELYLFISYARPDQSVAEQVETFLTAAGVRVFRDTSDIRAGANWDLAIERALQECHCMALLLSPASMPDRKEVHREWFRFDQKGKTIYPLYIQQCELHSRFDSRNYIDARNDLQGALEHLLKDMRRDFPLTEPKPGQNKAQAVETAGAEPSALPKASQALLDKVRSDEGPIELSPEEINAIKVHDPANLTEYRLGRIAEWSLQRYHLDKQFVNLALILDKGETDPQRWQIQFEDFRFNDLREVLDKAKDDPAIVLLGAPGSGKSTLLRRLQLDHSIDRLRDETDRISFFIQLNSYREANGALPEPREWLNLRWAALYPRLPTLDAFLNKGQGLLLLDALNEMPHQSVAEYHRLVGLWREFVHEAARQNNRIVFSCRSLDYSASLSGPDLRVPQVEVQPMNDGQMREFIRVYSAKHEAHIWNDLDDSRQFTLYRTPYFLKLLCDQVEATGEMPKGRAALFTGFIRGTLRREAGGTSELFKPGDLLNDRDHLNLSLSGKGLNPVGLPESGALILKLSDLAFSMQEKGLGTEGAQIRLNYKEACRRLAHPRAKDILEAGVAINALDDDIHQEEILFFHQLLQEYFAARHLAKEPKPELIRVEWEAEKVSPTLEETLAGLADGDPLPPLAQTGWEETTLTAAPMAKDPQGFIRDLIPQNLPLAARCAASPESKTSDELKREIQKALIARTRDMKADLRARIAAGEALGQIGDPRFERRSGPHGDYLLPPLVEIEGGAYPMGLNNAPYDREEPAHTIELEPFQIGMFPVTNAEYELFIEDGGYNNERWWDTEEARQWLRKGGAEGSKQQWREDRKTLQGSTVDYIQGLVSQGRITSQQSQDWITIRNWTDEQFEEWLDDQFPSGQIHRQPRFWDDTRFNNRAQPVVGVTWFEARAYCDWLTSNTSGRGERIFRLPTEAEFEAAARGKTGRMFPYGETFDVSRSNTFESHIRRTTPVGIFDNATPEGAFDLSGNAWTWTSTIYDQQKYPYPYKKVDGREDIHQSGVNRVLRGGSWDYFRDYARAVYRRDSDPDARFQLYRFSSNVGYASPFSIGFSDHCRCGRP